MDPETYLIEIKVKLPVSSFIRSKDEENATRLYPLSDYKPHKGEALQKGYLYGRYGALPFAGELRF